jgi:hypothetical protein
VKQEYNGLSNRTKLLLSSQEGFDVDFKKNGNGLEPEDLVAFTNSKKGGAILIGVNEIKKGNGRQDTEIVGCPVGDEAKLAIINKANSCIPNIEVSIFIENLAKKPFFRIEIKSGNNKPYCTNAGIYKIRGDGRILPIHPDTLLSMFIEKEGETFLRRFKNATQDIEETISKLKSKIEEDSKDLLYEIQDIGSRVDESLNDIFSSAENAESLSDDAMNISDDTLGEVRELSVITENIPRILRSIALGVDALLEKFNIEDPELREIREAVYFFIEMELNSGKGKKKIISDLNNTFHHVEKEQLEIWYKNKLKEKGSK